MDKFCIVVLVFFLSCTSEKPAATRDGKSSGPASGAATPYALELTPREATRNSTLNLIAAGFDLSKAKVEWLVNGRPFTTLVPTQFDGADAVKGNAVQARAIIEGREVESNVVQFMNTPPVITSVKLLPEIFKPGDVLSVEATAGDADGDNVSISYAWTVNGQPVGKGQRLAISPKRGDKISIKATPFDGTDQGAPIVVEREIANMPPVISENAEFNFDGNIYTYQVKATDPDGDALTYSLQSARAGMTIDPATGLLKWIVPPEFKGVQNATIVVDDGHGGIARYSTQITVK